MNTLLAPLKAVARDLVDRKLWPVAVLLLAALVALPILIGGGSSSENTAAPVASTATEPGTPGEATKLITVLEPGSRKGARPGRIKDPFYDPPEPRAAESATAAGAAVSAPGAAAASGGGASTGAGTSVTSSPPAQTTTRPQTTAPQPTTSVVRSMHHRTVVRWYAADAGKPRPLMRLTPLGGSSAPLALYLGVTKAKRTYAVFLLAPNAASDGDAECEDTDCRVIGLKAGQSQIVTMAAQDGAEMRRYRLEVASVEAITTDAAAAREMRAKVHTDGRAVMRAMWQHRPTADALQPIRYDRGSGLLFRTPAAKAPK